MKKVTRRVLTVHAQGASGGESMDPPVVSGSHSLTTNAEYIFVSHILSLSLIFA